MKRNSAGIELSARPSQHQSPVGSLFTRECPPDFSITWFFRLELSLHPISKASNRFGRLVVSVLDRIQEKSQDR
jgi:hypothetical protein